jgi:hypothetical protein
MNISFTRIEMFRKYFKGAQGLPFPVSGGGLLAIALPLVLKFTLSMSSGYPHPAGGNGSPWITLPQFVPWTC